MKTLYVYADFDWLDEPLLVGELGYESLRGSDSYSFKYDNVWLRQYGSWTLSPAYDMNPTLNEYQALLINSTTNHADLQVLLDSSEEYMIGKDEAVYIIEEVKAGVKHWKSIATRLGIAKREMDVFEQVFQRSLK